jgi:ADP-ribose pyrophosphatase YjhB (NUDIX family)
MPQRPPQTILAVGAVVLEPGGRVLLIRRARPPAVGTWTLPGGRVQTAEPLEAAVEREVREETAVAARVVSALGIVPLEAEGVTYAIHEYLLTPIGGEAPLPVAGDDAADARWVARDELEGLGVSPKVIELVDRGAARAAERATAPVE